MVHTEHVNSSFCMRANVNRDTEPVRLVVNCQFHRRIANASLKRVISPTSFKYPASIPFRARWTPKRSRYKLSFTNSLNVCAAFVSADIRALTVTGARHVTTLLTGASERHIVLGEPVKHRMTVVSGALPAA